MLRFLFRHIYKNKQIIKYLISGGAAAFTDLSLLYIFTEFLGIWYLHSAVLAFILAFFVSFYLQKFWTFRDNNREYLHKQMAAYFIVAGINLGINAGGMFILVDKFHILYILAQIIMGGLLAIESFLVYKFLIFSAASRKQKGEIKSIKILIATGIFPPDIGGPAAMIKELIGYLVGNNFKVKVITYADRGSQGQVNYQDKVVKVFSINRNRRAFFRYFFFLRRLLQLAEWADIIYATDTYSVGYFAYLTKIILHKRYIIRFAGDSAWEIATSNSWTNDYIMDFQKKFYNSKIEKIKDKRTKILVNADKVIAVSRFMADLAEMIGVKREKIRIIHNSADFMDKVDVKQEEIADIKSKYGGNAKIIIFSGRLTAWKGVGGIVKILPELKKRIGNVNFLVLGDGPQMGNLKSLAEKYNVAGNVKFLGKVKREETKKYFKASDLYILNSNYEGFSHALLDAMKSGLPIITTNIGGNSELVEDGKDGILINYNNKEQLLNACVNILTNRQLAQYLALNAQQKAEKFKLADTMNKTLSLLKEYV